MINDDKPKSGLAILKQYFADPIEGPHRYKAFSKFLDLLNENAEGSEDEGEDSFAQKLITLT